MDRMTLPHYDRKGYYMKCSEQFGCSGECTDCEELDKLVQRLAEYENKAEQQPTTNADRIRAMSDEELAKAISKLYDIDDIGDVSKLFCDGKAGCINARGDVDCNDDRIKACIVRWLQQPAEEDNHDPDKST